MNFVVWLRQGGRDPGSPERRAAEAEVTYREYRRARRAVARGRVAQTVPEARLAVALAREEERRNSGPRWRFRHAAEAERVNREFLVHSSRPYEAFAVDPPKATRAQVVAYVVEVVGSTALFVAGFAFLFDGRLTADVVDFHLVPLVVFGVAAELMARRRRIRRAEWARYPDDPGAYRPPSQRPVPPGPWLGH